MYCVTSLLLLIDISIRVARCALRSLREEGGARYRRVSAVPDNTRRSRVNWITDTLKQTDERSEALHNFENYLVTR